MLRMLRALADVAAFSLLAAGVLSGGCRGSAPGYDVSVTFNERVTDAALAEVDAVLRSYDPKARALMQPTFPPVVRATLHSGRSGLCPDLEATLRPRPDVSTVTCRSAAR